MEFALAPELVQLLGLWAGVLGASLTSIIFMAVLGQLMADWLHGI
jgi:hypothetical protein